MDELDELIEEFEWRASLEKELAKTAWIKESFDSAERCERNEIKYNRVAELLKELKEYRCKEMARQKAKKLIKGVKDK